MNLNLANPLNHTTVCIQILMIDKNIHIFGQQRPYLIQLQANLQAYLTNDSAPCYQYNIALIIIHTVDTLIKTLISIA